MLTTLMKEAFGYDDMNNSDRLLAEADRVEIEKGIPRASGMTKCEHCGCIFTMHPPVQGALWATRTCKDGIVKL